MIIRICFWLAVLVFIGGCASTPELPVADASVATLPASEEQVMIAQRRAEAIYSGWTEEEKAKFKKRPSTLLAVRSLNFSPEQAALLGAKVPSPDSAVCVLLWDSKTEKIVGTECFVVVAPPAQGETVRFGSSTAQFVGSF